MLAPTMPEDAAASYRPATGWPKAAANLKTTQKNVVFMHPTAYCG